MSVTAISQTGSRPSARKLAALLITTMCVAVVFWLVAALPYLSTRKESFGRFAEQFYPRRHGLWLHIAGGTLAMFTGPLQIWLGETRRRLDLHRSVGYAYLAGFVLSECGAYYMALTTRAGVVYASGLFGMATAALIATSMAYIAIRWRNFVQHREWMIRSYVVLLAFVFFRFELAITEAYGIGGPGNEGLITRIGLAAWSSWAIPLLVTEALLQYSKLRGRR
jgi:hypothetical protein